MQKIKAKIYAQALYEICQESKNLDLALAGFVKMLAKQNRLKIFSQIIREFNRLYNQQEKTADVSIFSAQDLDAADKEAIITYVKKLSKAKTVYSEEKKDAQLLGGFKISVDDWQVDATLKRQLELLKINLIK